ncbi:MAG: hypothetical protein BWK78_03395 [Thiotrichaceae bacterium IS1]|nr:MAG: hypothetical protein BWK78_03395 [Thiotrichaceae bacterium IS1]
MIKFICLICLSWILATPVLSMGQQENVDMGESYFQQGRFELAADYWEKQLAESEKPQDYLEVSVQLATTYQLLGRLQRAYEVLKKAEERAKTFGDQVYIAEVFSQLSDIYFALRDSKLRKYDSGNDTWLNKLGLNPFTRENLVKKASDYLDKAERVIGGCETNSNKGKNFLLCANIMNKRGSFGAEEGKENAKNPDKYEDAKEEYEKAVGKYNEAKKYAEQAGNGILTVNVLVNIIQTKLQKVELEKDLHNRAQQEIYLLQQPKLYANASATVADYEETKRDTASIINSVLKEVAETVLPELQKKVQLLPDNNYDKAFALISVANFAKTLLTSLTWHQQETREQQNSTEEVRKSDRVRLQVLQQASSIANSLKNNRLLAYAKSALAQLYADRHYYGEAVHLTQQAIFYTQNYPTEFLQKELWGYPELLCHLEGQLGDFLEAEGEYPKAIDAYKRSISHFEEVQQRYGSYPSSLLQSVKEISINLLDLLLKQPRRDELDNLKKVEAVANSFNSLGIQNFFMDSCATEKFKTEDKPQILPNDTAALFIIAHHDEIDLLLKMGEGLSVETVKGCNKGSGNEKIATSDCLKEKAKEFSDEIYEKRFTNTGSFDPGLNYDPNHGKALYDFLIRPTIGKLEENRIQNLLVIPVNFPIIPFAALYDGGKYLIERYGVVTGYHSESYGSLIPGYILQNDKLLLSALPTTANPLLSYIANEIKITNLFATKKELIDKDFTGSNLENSMSADEPHDSLHFSTHGNVAGSIFIQAFNNEQLTIDRLEEILEQQKQPPKLLTFSACESVVGNKDNWLGLSGMAVKTGGHNAIGTLWKVDSQSTAHLMVEFYKQLVCKKSSIATALQQSQLCLIKGGSPYCLSNPISSDKSGDGKDSPPPLSCEEDSSPNKKWENSQWNDPYYWAPFLIIGR